MLQKKKPVALTLVILFVLLTICLNPIDTVKANPIGLPTVPSVQIGYPSSSFSHWVNSTLEYVNRTVELQATVNVPVDSPTVTVSHTD